MFETVIKSHEQIKREKKDVFDYVTTPMHWPTWYPLTTKVTKVKGHIQNSPNKNDECSEIIHSPFLRRQIFLQAVFNWKIVENKRPDLFVFKVERPSKSYITYRFEERQEMIDGKMQAITTWYRELTYTPRNWFMGILNKLWFERIVLDASEEALRNVKRILNEQP